MYIYSISTKVQFISIFFKGYFLKEERKKKRIYYICPPLFLQRFSPPLPVQLFKNDF